MARPSARSAWLVGAASIIVTMATVLALHSLVPVRDQDPSVIVFSPQGPAAQGPNDAGHTLVQVGADLVADPPQFEVFVGADDAVHSATLLAKGPELYAYGVLSTNDRVYLTITNPTAGTAAGREVSYDDFEEDGVSLADSGIEVTWRSDGTVTWQD